MLSDTRVAIRGLSRQPGFAIVVVLTAALGIGATTAIFSVVNTVLLRPLPYRDPGSLVRVLNRNSFPDMEDWIEQNQTLDAFGGYNGWSADLLSVDAPERVQGAIVTGALFPILDVAPALGRFIRPEDNVPGGEHVMVSSHGFWQERLGGRSDVLGTTLSLNGNPTTIIGVNARGLSPAGNRCGVLVAASRRVPGYRARTRSALSDLDRKTRGRREFLIKLKRTWMRSPCDLKRSIPTRTRAGVSFSNRGARNSRPILGPLCCCSWAR